VLVPSDDQNRLPTLHGRSVPVATRGQWEQIPEVWLSQPPVPPLQYATP
jgi:hypothetical protein